MNLLISNGRVIDPVNGKEFEADLLTAEGKIKKIGKDIDAGDNCRIIDASGKIVVPGLIDLHVHLREPGFEHKETIASGTRSAARGGFTSVFPMANTDPVVDNASVVEFILSRAREEAAVEIYPVGSITKNLAGEELSEMGAMASKGAKAVSDDGKTVASAAVMRRAMEYAKNFSLSVIAHCEDENLSRGGLMHEGYYSTVLGLPPIPAAAEEIIIARDLILAELTGVHLHIAHVSTSGSVNLIRRAKEKGIKVTAEVTPHHLTLTHSEVKSYNPHTKVNPPLRTQKDITALREGLKNGIIDIVATDHAPHASHEKMAEYEDVPSGISGLETAFAVLYTELVKKSGEFTLLELIEKMTLNPAEIIGIERGTLSMGETANISIIDLDTEWLLTEEEIISKGKNTPYIGKSFYGRPTDVIVQGRVVIEDEELRV